MKKAEIYHCKATILSSAAILNFCKNVKIMYFMFKTNELTCSTGLCVQGKATLFLNYPHKRPYMLEQDLMSSKNIPKFPYYEETLHL
jgi:hypothetical protein